jgi:hypothetical protein
VRFRQEILPMAPIPLPDCLRHELEFAERHCQDPTHDRLFPIRFLWLLEANEQRRYGHPPLVRSHYHPEELLSFWKRAAADPEYRRAREAEGFRFDLMEKAVELTAGWVYIGDRFIRDLFAVEATLGVTLQFPCPPYGQRRPAFPACRRPPRP